MGLSVIVLPQEMVGWGALNCTSVSLPVCHICTAMTPSFADIFSSLVSCSCVQIESKQKLKSSNYSYFTFLIFFFTYSCPLFCLLIFLCKSRMAKCHCLVCFTVCLCKLRNWQKKNTHTHWLSYDSVLSCVNADVFVFFLA